MILLIDGYNLIKNAYAQSRISDSLRSQFINKLNSYSKQKNIKIIIVFDGGDSAYPTREYFGAILVIYSGYNLSADEVIKDLLSENKSTDLLLVTSDRELQKIAQALSVEFITSQDFYKIFQSIGYEQNQKLQKDQTVYKTSDDSHDIDDIMSQLPNIDIKKEDAIITSKHRYISEKISKKEKKLNQKIKKL